MVEVTADQMDSKLASYDGPEEVPDTIYALEAMAEHKRRGVELAVLARWIMLPIVAVFLVAVHPVWSQFYYVCLLGILCVNGWFIRRFARVGRSKAELALILFDLLLMTVGMTTPNPFDPQSMPVPMLYEYGNFIYFFLILSLGTLAYSWRTVVAIGIWTSVIWLCASMAVWLFSEPDMEIGRPMADLLGPESHMWELINPNDVRFQMRIQEAIVFLMVAGTLALSTRRFYQMLLNSAGLERERANLSRYFSPNVVDQLSQNDEPLKQVRSEDVAVLFIDIVGFTQISQGKDAYEVIELLRGFHARMEGEVFRFGGTLDKYLGDGLMATFGTPMAGEADATKALSCALAMQQSLQAWNVERRRRGEVEINAGIGLHYGQVVLGDIGANRLEYAVIGTAVNVSSRLEKLTRTVGSNIVLSADLYDQVRNEANNVTLLDHLERRPNQVIRGLDAPMTVWVLPQGT